MSNTANIRNVALSVIALLRKVRSPNGMTLKNIHQYMKAAYPNKSPNIIALNSVLEKASAIGAIKKKNNRYILGHIIKKVVSAKDRQAFNSMRRGGRRRRSRSRSRRRRSRRRR